MSGRRSRSDDPGLEVGSRVKCHFKALPEEEVYPGEVKEVLGGGWYSILHDDADITPRIFHSSSHGAGHGVVELPSGSKKTVAPPIPEGRKERQSPAKSKAKTVPKANAKSKAKAAEKAAMETKAKEAKAAENAAMEEEEEAEVVEAEAEKIDASDDAVQKALALTAEALHCNLPTLKLLLYGRRRRPLTRAGLVTLLLGSTRTSLRAIPCVASVPCSKGR